MDGPQVVTQMNDELKHGLCRVVDKISERHTGNNSRQNEKIVATTTRLEKTNGTHRMEGSATASSSN